MEHGTMRQGFLAANPDIIEETLFPEKQSQHIAGL
jgi:hypothetical protein